MCHLYIFLQIGEKRSWCIYAPLVGKGSTVTSTCIKRFHCIASSPTFTAPSRWSVGKMHWKFPGTSHISAINICSSLSLTCCASNNITACLLSLTRCFVQKSANREYSRETRAMILMEVTITVNCCKAKDLRNACTRNNNVYERLPVWKHLLILSYTSGLAAGEQ